MREEGSVKDECLKASGRRWNPVLLLTAGECGADSRRAIANAQILAVSLHFLSKLPPHFISARC